MHIYRKLYTYTQRNKDRSHLNAIIIDSGLILSMKQCRPWVLTSVFTFIFISLILSPLTNNYITPLDYIFIISIEHVLLNRIDIYLHFFKWNLSNFEISCIGLSVNTPKLILRLIFCYLFLEYIRMLFHSFPKIVLCVVITLVLIPALWW